MPTLGYPLAGGWLLACIVCVGTSWASDSAPVSVTLQDHRFTPAEIHVKAGQPVTLEITNADSTPEEFEMHAPAIEKIIAGGGHATVRLRPLQAGSFGFVGEYHEDVAKGVIVAE